MSKKEYKENLYMAWAIIANAYGGNWDLASKEWKKCAETWRDTVFDKEMKQRVKSKRLFFRRKFMWI